MYKLCQKFIIDTKNYSDLAPVFKNILDVYLEMSGIPLEGNAYIVTLASNRRDLKNNRKPCGYNPGLNVNKLIFPIRNNGTIELDILWPNNERWSNHLENCISGILQREGLEHIIQRERNYPPRPKNISKESEPIL